MKIFIYLCCIAHLLTVISARWLTTPMPSAFRSNDYAARQTKYAEMIDFVNSVLNEDGRSIARSGSYVPMLRRFVLPSLKRKNLPPSVAEPNEEDKENLVNTVRYQVIDNPEVLEEYSNKQKQKKLGKRTVVSDTSADAKSFSTEENKLKYYHSKSNSAASLYSANNNKFDEFLRTPHPNPVDDVQEHTTVEITYRPSFPDDDDDDDDDEKPIKDDITVSVTETETSTPRTDAKSYDDLKINSTVEIENRTQDNKASSKEDQAGIEEKKTPMDDAKETGQLKEELPLKKDKNNDDGVTVNEEKIRSDKEYISSKLENPSTDSVRPRDEHYKNDGNKNINITTDTSSEKDNKLKERSSDTKKVISVPLESLMEKSALRTKQRDNNYDYKEQHAIYSHKEREENSNKQFKNSHEKRDEYDRKENDNNDDVRSKKEKNSNKIDKKRYNKDNVYDRIAYEWNNRHQQYAENDNWNINDNERDKNEDFDSRDRDSNKRDSDWGKRDNDWKNRDNDWTMSDFVSNERDNDWNNRDIDSNKRDNDWNNRDIDSNKRDNDWNNRDIDSNKRDTEWIRQDSNIYKNDRKKNDVGQKRNEWENKYSHMSVENGGGITHEKYEKKIKDGDNRHYEI